MAGAIDDGIRRVIEESHETALSVLREHMDELHKLSAILIERETIDKDQFERLLAGEDEAEVFADAGIRDIVIAYPVVGADKAERVAQIAAGGIAISVNVDSALGAEELSAAAR